MITFISYNQNHIILILKVQLQTIAGGFMKKIFLILPSLFIALNSGASEVNCVDSLYVGKTYFHGSITQGVFHIEQEKMLPNLDIEIEKIGTGEISIENSYKDIIVFQLYENGKDVGVLEIDSKRGFFFNSRLIYKGKGYGLGLACSVRREGV